MTVPLLSFTPEATSAILKSFRGRSAVRLIEDYADGEVSGYRLLPAFISGMVDSEIRTTVRTNCRKIYFLVDYEIMKKIEYSEVSYDSVRNVLIIKNLITVEVPI